jgi:hypothetical protein
VGPDLGVTVFLLHPVDHDHPLVLDGTDEVEGVPFSQRLQRVAERAALGRSEVAAVEPHLRDAIR